MLHLGHFFLTYRENKPGAVQSATGLRNRALLSKGFRKWLLKYRGQCFERKRGVGLLARVFVVWYQVVGQRGRDMLSATAFNQQVRMYVGEVSNPPHLISQPY